MTIEKSHEYFVLTFVKRKNIWKIFWMRANLK
ncbi:MAG: DUF3024 domain-containing protein [Spirosoma sp.]|nr:DUF3024 domain-containing protein [Spirosoma sp.]